MELSSTLSRKRNSSCTQACRKTLQHSPEEALWLSRGLIYRGNLAVGLRRSPARLRLCCCSAMRLHGPDLQPVPPPFLALVVGRHASKTPLQVRRAGRTGFPGRGRGAAHGVPAADSPRHRPLRATVGAQGRLSSTGSRDQRPTTDAEERPSAQPVTTPPCAQIRLRLQKWEPQRRWPPSA